MKSPRQNRGVALVIVLALMVLLSGLILASLMRTQSEQQLSSSSANSAKTELLTQAALGNLLGDLRQEIIAGSTRITASGTNTTVAYSPTRATTAAPFRVGTDDALPNLIKRSANRQPFYGASALGYDDATFPPPNRAAALPTTTPSTNGRMISAQRWNKPLLLPKQTPASSSDLSPLTPPFVVPDWVVVSRDGTNPVAWSNDLKNTSNNAFAVGRYAYTVYDEGGLLDVNAAGYPSSATAAQRGRKEYLAFADLTQIPGITATHVNSLVGWRNYATAQPDGNFPNFTFTPAKANAFLDALTTNRNGFLAPFNRSVFNSGTDRSFAGRQELIRFFTQALAPTSAPLQNALQYLGTFSRDLNQPSFFPDPQRPKIGGPSPALPSPASYMGNNDAQGLDDQINPPFLSIRVRAPFVRWDGTQAVAGEPLVNKRFPLSRLGLLTPTATADRNSLIYKYFGLTRARASDPWTYDHGIANRVIGKLDEVAALAGTEAREPDFVELLKASLLAGSLGKGSASGGLAGAYTHRRDISLDYQVVRIFANIVDQADTDGFPTRIALIDGETMAGVENLPYFYRHRVVPIVLRPPSRVSASGRPEPNTPPLTDEGLGVLLLVPELWNPHDANSSIGSPRPTAFRLLYDAALPDSLGSAAGVSSVTVNTFEIPANPAAIPPEPGILAENKTRPANIPLNASTTELLFQIPDAQVFREPIFLGQAGRPAAIQLALGTGHALRGVPTFSSALGGVVDKASPASTAPFLGVHLGTYPLRTVAMRTVPPATTAAPYIFTARTVNANLPAPSPTLTVRLQFQAPDGNWATYNTQTLDNPALGTGVVPLLNNNPGKNFLILGGGNSWAQCGDPRTSRFGLARAYNPPNLILDAASCSLRTSRADRGSGWGAADVGQPSSGTSPALVNARIGWAPTNVPFGARDGGSQTQWRPGLLAQNRTDVNNDGRKDGTPGSARTRDPIFYSDPDGVPRRAAGAYVEADDASTWSDSNSWSAKTATGLPTVTATQFPSMTPTAQSQSRPLILNRPFRSVAELGYVFRDMPWKNLDFFTPESPDTALLDVFCVNEDLSLRGVVGAKVNLNTRHTPVIKALLSGTARDEMANVPAGAWSRTIQPGLSQAEVDRIASALLSRTRSADVQKGPLRNVGELVGKFVPGYTSAYGQAYDGFSSDLGLYDGAALSPNNLIQRFRESAIRALADVGTVRVWNLLIDLTAQSGRYTPSANSLEAFTVEGEKRVWLHVALDRFTGEVIDRQLEVVSE